MSSRSQEGLICLENRSQRGPASGPKVQPVFTQRPCYKSSGSQCCDVLALCACLPSWECGDDGFTHRITWEAWKRETTMTSMRAEVLVCVKKSKGKLGNASDSWRTKGNKITKALLLWILGMVILLLCTSAFTSLSFQTFPLKWFLLYVVRHCNL